MARGPGREQAVASGWPGSWPSWLLDALGSQVICFSVGDRVYWGHSLFVDLHRGVDMDEAGCSQGPPLHV